MQASLQPPRYGDAEPENPYVGRDKRRHQRVPLRLGGRFLLGESDFALMSINVSCGGGLFRAKTIPAIYTKVVCYIDELGRIAGEVVRSDEDSFAVAFEATDRKRDKLADQLMWLLNKGRYGLREVREAPRYAGGKQAIVVRANGQKIKCRVRDLSVTGAAFEVEGPLPFIGERVRAGRLHGIVVRAESGEFAMRIVKPESSDSDTVVT